MAMNLCSCIKTYSDEKTWIQGLKAGMLYLAIQYDMTWAITENTQSPAVEAEKAANYAN